MLLSRSRRLLLAPLGALLLVTATHLGASSGSYRSSRPDAAPKSHGVSIALDGFMWSSEGIPAQVDAANAVRLQSLFRGAPGAEAGGIQDFRPLPSFLMALPVPLLGDYWSGVLVNLLAFALAAACALDLARLLRRPPLVGVAFATLLVGTRGVAFSVGCPDAHALSLAWLPIGVWACERLRVFEREPAPLATPVVTLLFGLAALTHLSDLTLVGYLWLRGLASRTPPERLVGITAGVAVILLGWRLAGSASGLPFSGFTDDWIGRGFKDMLRDAGARLSGLWQPPSPGKGGRANALLQGLRGLPPWGLIETYWICVTSAFGVPLLLLSAAGLWVASRRERLLSAVWFLLPLLIALPILYNWTAPRLLLPAWLGLAWLAALALGAAERWCRTTLERWGSSPCLAAGVARATFLAGLLGLLLLENADALGGDPSAPVALMWGGL